MGKARKARRATVYVDPWPLAVLAVDPDTAGVRYALRALARMVAEENRGLARSLGGEEWALLYAALADECEGSPEGGEGWADKVRFAVDDYAEANYGGCMADPGVAGAVGGKLRPVLRDLGEVQAVAMLAAVRYAKREADAGISVQGKWWELYARTRDV